MTKTAKENKKKEKKKMEKEEEKNLWCSTNVYAGYLQNLCSCAVQ